MGLNCGCPAGPSLSSLNIADCKESLGQIQKVIFQRIFKSSGEKNAIPEADIKLKAKMALLLSATDGTKLIISPYIQGPTTTPGDARKFGGGNQTLGGIEIIIGREPTTFEGMIYQEKQSTIKQLKAYQCENIGVYLVDENGNIAGIKEGTSFLPIPVQGFFVGDKKLGGYEEPDSNSIKWSFFPNWSDNLEIVKPTDYNPLTDLKNV